MNVVADVTVYGLTETQGIVTLTPKSGCPYGGERMPETSVGLPVVNCQLKVETYRITLTLGVDVHVAHLVNALGFRSTDPAIHPVSGV
jgi:hypothetical protein